MRWPPERPGGADTGCGAFVLGGDYRALGVVRSLGRHGIPVWVVRAPEDHRLAALSRYSRRNLLCRTGDDDARTEFLTDVARRSGLDRWVLFPTADASAAYVARQHAALSGSFTPTTPPWAVFRCGYDKRETARLAEALGIPQPLTTPISSREDVERYDGPFPVIIKPAVKPHLGLPKVKAWPAADRAELLRSYLLAARQAEPDSLLLQELIPGAGHVQYSFAALCRHGTPVASMTAERVRQHPRDFGRSSTLVVTVDEPGVEKAARRLLAEIGLTGLVEVEFKRDLRDGQLLLLDINMRVWGWHTIGREAGVDFSYLAWRQATGQAVEEVRAPAGLRWLRLTTDTAAGLEEIAAGDLSAPAYLRSVLRPHERAVAAADDPLPGLAEVPLFLRKVGWSLLTDRGRAARTTTTPTPGGAEGEPVASTTGRRSLTARGRYLGRAAAAVARQPGEGVQRTVERLVEWWDLHRRPCAYRPTEEYEPELERLLGAPLRDDRTDFQAVWARTLEDVRSHGLETGRGAFGGWDDGDVRLALLAWRVTRHLRPGVAVETGVARGLTTRVLLEAMDRNGSGELWSIDLPPLIERGLSAETAVAVTPDLRRRWTLLTGSSRRRLPELLRRLPRVDLFVHDSMHTTRNLRFELESVWPALSPGGAVLIDDVERNRATADFLKAHPDADGMICPAEDGRAVLALIVKRPG